MSKIKVFTNQIVTCDFHLNSRTDPNTHTHGTEAITHTHNTCYFGAIHCQKHQNLCTIFKNMERDNTVLD